MNYDSIKNQEIKRKFVEREVLCCVTDLVDYIIKKNYEGYDPDAPFTEEDIENYLTPVCPECYSNYGFEEINDAFKCVECDLIYEGEPEECECHDPEYDYDSEFEPLDVAYKCKKCGHILEDIDELDLEEQEVYEWWTVTPWLGEKLKKHGEVVIELYGYSIWGRCTTGQAILLDHVISKICEEMEILEGQKYEWNV